MSFIESPLPNALAWIRHFEQVNLPVLARTIEALNVLKADIDDIAPRDIANVIEDDPLMSLKTLIWAGKHLADNVSAMHSALANDIETVNAAIVNAGIARFYREFDQLDCVETRLIALPEAQHGLDRVLARSTTAAEFARDWASYRNDTDIEVIAEAAMLHDVAEMLVWIFAPTLALRMQSMHECDAHTRTRDIQKSVLGITLNELQLAILTEWRLPSLFKRLMDDAHADSSQVKNVVLATKLSRHLANSHVDAALPDDFAEIAALLRTSPEWVRERTFSSLPDAIQ